MATRQEQLTDRIVRDPEILLGKPTVRGTRIPVDLVLEHLAYNPDIKELLAAYPRLSLDDVKACRAYPTLSLLLSAPTVADYDSDEPINLSIPSREEVNVNEPRTGHKTRPSHQ